MALRLPAIPHTWKGWRNQKHQHFTDAQNDVTRITKHFRLRDAASRNWSSTSSDQWSDRSNLVSSPPWHLLWQWPVGSWPTPALQIHPSSWEIHAANTSEDVQFSKNHQLSKLKASALGLVAWKSSSPKTPAEKRQRAKPKHKFQQKTARATTVLMFPTLDKTHSWSWLDLPWLDTSKPTPDVKLLWKRLKISLVGVLVHL